MKDDDGMGTLLDFNTASPVQEKPDHSRNGRERIERIRLEANANALAILHHLLPGGRIVGSEFEAGDVSGSPGHSLKFSLRSDKFGVWSDFAASQTGGDIIDLWKANRKCDFKTAIEQIEKYLNLIPLRNPDGHSRNHATRTDRAEKTRRDLGPPTNTWYYHDASGNIVAKVTRYDPEPGDKEFRPWDCKTNKCTHPSPRPLYNLPGILNEKRVVLVEGEKCADALKSLGIPATTAMGGSHAPPDRTDWTALKGKEVVIWRDNDTPGIKYAENSCKAIEAVGGTVKILPLPEGKPAKWDAADAVSEGFDVRGFIESGFKELEEKPAQPKMQLADWCSSKAYTGKAPEREWLVNHTFPMGSVSVIAAMGGAGKGMLGLDLALKVACDYEPDLLNPYPMAFGNGVMQHGTAVVLSAEDDRDEIFRRLESLDPAGERRKKDRLIVVPMPDIGGPMPLVVSGKKNPQATPHYYELKKQLLGLFASLAKETGAAVLVMHHLSKLPVSEKKTITVDTVRSLIKGVTAIVDGSRLSYALWPLDKDNARGVCKAMNVPWERNKVVGGAVVKTNAPVDMEIKTFIRNENGLLISVTEILRNVKTPEAELRNQLIEDIKKAAEKGRPFTATSDQSPYNRKEELSIELRHLGRQKLAKLTNDLLDSARIFKTKAPGSSVSKWLDVLNGPFQMGCGKFEAGFDIE